MQFLAMSTYAGSLSECQLWLQVLVYVNIRLGLAKKVHRLTDNFRRMNSCDKQ